MKSALRSVLGYSQTSYDPSFRQEVQKAWTEFYGMQRKIKSQALLIRLLIGSNLLILGILVGKLLD